MSNNKEELNRKDDFYLIRRLKARRGHEEKAKSALSKLLYQARIAKGCQGFDVFQGSIDMTSGKLESSLFIIKELWQDRHSESEFESSLEYLKFCEVRGQFFEDKFEILQGITSSAGNSDQAYWGKAVVTTRLKIQKSLKEIIESRILERSANLKSRTECLKSEVYQGVGEITNSEVYVLEELWEDSRAVYESGIHEPDSAICSSDELIEPLEKNILSMLSTPVGHLSENAVLGDTELMAGLMKLNPDFGELCISASAIPWGKPLLDQKTKVLLAVAIDVVEQITGKPFENHISMALKQGISREEIEELLLFLTIYVGFNKAGAFYPELNRIFGPKADA